NYGVWLTCGFYVAITPASTARRGNKVPQGKSNFGLLLSAMIASTCTDLREIRSSQASCLRFINWFVLWAAGQSQKRIRTKPASDSCEREKTASAWQQRLQRAAIDTAFVSPMARKFGSQGATASQPSFVD